jgi:hypothetical protein
LHQIRQLAKMIGDLKGSPIMLIDEGGFTPAECTWLDFGPA